MRVVKHLTFFVLIGILFLSSNFAFAQVSSKEAEIVLVKGDVKIQRAGKVEWFDAKEGMKLSDGDTAKTGKASSVEIAFDMDKKNVIRLEENSTAILRGRWLRQIELPNGRIRSLIRKLRKDSSFEIRTPTAVAGARGSGWDVFSEANRDQVKAFEDEIFVRSFDEEGNLIKEIIVREGWQAFIERFEAPSELFELTDVERRDWDSWKEDLSERAEIERKQEGEDRGAEFSPAESVSETIQEQSDYKDQIFETQEIEQIEDRAATGEKSERGGGGGTPSGGGDGGGGYP